MQQSIGELIWQARRQRHLTQTELGGERYSKSYISAVERGKIVASLDALRFFAEQLGHPGDYFTTLLQVGEGVRQLTVLNGPGPGTTPGQTIEDDELTVLDILLESTEFHNFPVRREFELLSPEFIEALPALKQARYYFLMGLAAQEKRDLSAARHAFERALALAPSKHHPAILDALGVNYYLAQAYSTALGYHQRALRLLQAEPSKGTTALQCKVELHCAHDCHALGAYQQACEYYEGARQHLEPGHDIKTAALLYWGLGYCKYATIFRTTAFTLPTDKRAKAEEIEREFQDAVGFLLQSRILYQVASDRMGETWARLALTQVLLDFSTRRRQVVQEQARRTIRQSFVNVCSLLDEAEEQCRQVLLGWQDEFRTSTTPPAELDNIIYVALANLIRVFAQRATLARLGGYTDTADRERALAGHLCQQMLDTFSESALPWALIHNAVTLHMSGLASHMPSLPQLPDLFASAHTVLRSPISQVQVYFAAAEVAEEFGRGAATYDYAVDCYAHANQCFSAALAAARSVVPDREHDLGFLARCYQRCVCILEERSLAAPELSQETLLDILKDGLYRWQHPILPAEREAKEFSLAPSET